MVNRFTAENDNSVDNSGDRTGCDFSLGWIRGEKKTAKNRVGTGVLLNILCIFDIVFNENNLKR